MHPAASQPSQNCCRGKIIDVAEVNQRRWLQESGPWLENVDRTHLVLASGKPALQKKRKTNLQIKPPSVPGPEGILAALEEVSFQP